jgi:hypothetical protein
MKTFINDVFEICYMVKSQTATEYLVITAVVIVLALVTIGILGGIPGIGSKNSGRMSSAQLTSRDVAIVSYSVTDTGTSVVIRNNNPNVIRINNLSVNNTPCIGPTFPITMNPGQTRTVFCPNINGTAGARYNYPVSVGWSDFYNAKYIDYGEFRGRAGEGNVAPGGPGEPGGPEEPDIVCENEADFCSGEGTEEDPYIITTCQHLQNMKENLTAHYELGGNVNCDVAPFNIGEGFEPVGSMGSVFFGTFNGKGFTISNLFINRPSTSNVGLFGVTIYSALQNLRLENIVVNGGSNTGALAGVSEESVIMSVIVSGNITGENVVGGLVGFGIFEMFNSSSSASVIGASLVGGIVGYIESSTIDSSSNFGSVTGTSSVGGLVGHFEGGIIRNALSIGDISGVFSIGGLVGSHLEYSQLLNSYAVGSIVGTSSIGGLIGHREPSSSIVSSYYNLETSGQSDDDGRGLPRTTYNMTTPTSDTYVSWDFVSIWSHIPGQYPRLAWQD